LPIAEQATAEGTYVALTRAREQTHIHVSQGMMQDGELEPFERLAKQVGRADPEVPAIALPLADQRSLEREADREAKSGSERDMDIGWEL
jgi:hypothetical protein